MYSIIKQTSKIFGGSAVAGVGFSLGRDAYRKAKKNKGILLAMIAAMLSIWGVVLSGIKLGRNYRTVGQTLVSKFLGCCMAIPSFAVSAVAFTVIALCVLALSGYENTVKTSFGPVRFYPPHTQIEGPGTANNDIYNYPLIRVNNGKIETHFEIFIGAAASASIFFIGVLIGIIQRNKRAKVFAIEKKNEAFLESHDLTEISDDRLKDVNTDQVYRIESISGKLITLFPEGRRGKRAYIELSENGQFLAINGLVDRIEK